MAGITYSCHQQVIKGSGVEPYADIKLSTWSRLEIRMKDEVTI
jgi:hypothetical protein